MNNEDIGEIQKTLEIRMKTQKETLSIKARQMARQLTRISDRLDKPNWLDEVGLISDLGEIQVRGPLIDVHCASLRAYQKIYDEIRKKEIEDE